MMPGYVWLIIGLVLGVVSLVITVVQEVRESREWRKRHPDIR
jgi:heme exporter protein D